VNYKINYGDIKMGNAEDLNNKIELLEKELKLLKEIYELYKLIDNVKLKYERVPTYPYPIPMPLPYYPHTIITSATGTILE